VYSSRYRVDIGPHVFPTEKYSLIAARVGGPLVEPHPATWDELALVHTTEYLAKMRDGTMTADDIAELELPWSPAMVDAFRLMTGGSIDAACLACSVDRASRKSEVRSLNHSDFRLPTSDFRDFRDFRVVCHIGGGLHHAFPNHGEGFCPFNDVAVAARVLQQRGMERMAIVDLDVHHGNGTAFVFESDPGIFTFSMHQQHNYPMWKPRSTLDIGLPDGVHDETYLRELDRALPQVMAHGPQCVFYLAGADPYEDDQLGGLKLTQDGLRQRDRRVISAVRAAGVPLVIVLAGGYARHVEDTVAIHTATIEEARGAEAGWAGGAG
jgi:acetoin utilization deacetylase AcuC-like enzyme